MEKELGRNSEAVSFSIPESLPEITSLPARDNYREYFYPVHARWEDEPISRPVFDIACEDYWHPSDEY